MRGNTDTRRFDAYVPRGVLRWLASCPDTPVQTLEGTVVFVDISGFTRLSERLARNGREGAEQITDTINSTFSVLLADAHRGGGSLLKFGGDALLLWFDGPQHAARACATAVAMRHSLREVGRIRAGASEIVLRMSVGVHTGFYEQFLVGDSHREFLIAGPAATVVVSMEAHASAGQILVSPHTAELLPSRCLGSVSGPGVLLARSPAGKPWSEETLAQLPPEAAVARCLSTAIRAHLMAAPAAPAAPEHRTATVAFLQFGGLDELIATGGQREAAAAVDVLVRRAQEAADRYEICALGSDIAADGGKLLFSAGAPRAVGDDEERMLLAMRHIVAGELPLPVRVGVNRGYTFTGEVGPPYRRTYAVMGDVVNLSARLTAKARWGTVLSTQGALANSRTRFAVTQVPPFMVKGKLRPVEAAEVGPATRAATPGSIGSQLPLVGRALELSLIEKSVKAAMSGQGELIDLVGEAGSGKSRLLAEARMLGGGMRVLHLACEAYTQAIPYIGWREPLRELFGLPAEGGDGVLLVRLRKRIRQSNPELAPWLPLLAIAAGVEAPSTREVEELSSDFRAAKLHEVVLRMLSSALREPTLVLVEDAHLMDDASAELLAALAEQLGESAWLVIVARRELAGGFQPRADLALRLELEPLKAEATRALAESTPEAHLIPPHVLELAVHRCAGSPAFLLDFLAAAAGGSEVLPDSIEAAASARIDALDPGDRRLVRRAAVLGLGFRPERLRHVLDPAEPMPEANTWNRLDRLFARDADGHVRFRSPIVCEAAYVGLPFKVRRALHAAVAEALEPDLGREVDADPAVLSLHFSLAGEHTRAWEYALMGARRAAARFAHADAARLYRRAIQAGRSNGATSAELAAAWEALGEELRLTGEPKAALQALATARRMVAGDALAEARLLHRHADIAERHERLAAAVRWLRRGLKVLEGVDGHEAEVWRARLIADLGGVRMREGHVADAVRLSREAIAKAESIGELRALARACYLLDWALFESGQREQATHSERALEIYDHLGDPERAARATINLGTFAYVEGRWDDAVALYRQGAELSLRAGNRDVAAAGECNIGEIFSDQGRLEEATVYLERARRIWRSVSHVQGVAFVTVLLGRLAGRQGRYTDAINLLELAIAELTRMNLAIYLGLARACLAEVEAMGGDPERALAIAEELLAARNGSTAMVGRVRAIALARLNRLAEAVQELERSVAAAVESESDYDLAAALDLLEGLGALASEDGALERDDIMHRLHIEWLPRPEVAQPPAATLVG